MSSYELEKCRLCLKLGVYDCTIFQTDNGSMQIAEMAMACADVKIYKGDGLSAKVCADCIQKVNLVYLVNRQLEQADRDLRRDVVPGPSGNTTQSAPSACSTISEAPFKQEAQSPSTSTTGIQETPHDNKSNIKLENTESYFRGLLIHKSDKDSQNEYRDNSQEVPNVTISEAPSNQGTHSPSTSTLHRLPDESNENEYQDESQDTNAKNDTINGSTSKSDTQSPLTLTKNNSNLNGIPDVNKRNFHYSDNYFRDPILEADNNASQNEYKHEYQEVTSATNVTISGSPSKPDTESPSTSTRSNSNSNEISNDSGSYSEQCPSTSTSNSNSDEISDDSATQSSSNYSRSNSKDSGSYSKPSTQSLLTSTADKINEIPDDNGDLSTIKSKKRKVERRPSCEHYLTYSRYNPKYDYDSCYDYDSNSGVECDYESDSESSDSDDSIYERVVVKPKQRPQETCKICVAKFNTPLLREYTAYVLIKHIELDHAREVAKLFIAHKPSALKLSMSCVYCGEVFGVYEDYRCHVNTCVQKDLTKPLRCLFHFKEFSGQTKCAGYINHVRNDHFFECISFTNVECVPLVALIR